MSFPVHKRTPEINEQESILKSCIPQIDREQIHETRPEMGGLMERLLSQDNGYPHKFLAPLIPLREGFLTHFLALTQQQLLAICSEVGGMNA